MKISAFAAVAASSLLLSSAAFASEVDNPGIANFVFYDNPGSPFLNFASGELASSYTPASGAPTGFQAEVDEFGTTLLNSPTLGFHDTDLSISSTVQVQFYITELDGYTDCSGPLTSCDVDWNVTAYLRFKNGGTITTTNCRTSTFTFEVHGNWGDVDSDPVTFPALTGSGSGACGTWASTINNFFDLGTSGASVSFYKFRGKDSTGAYLTGS